MRYVYIYIFYISFFNTPSPFFIRCALKVISVSDTIQIDTQWPTPVICTIFSSFALCKRWRARYSHHFFFVFQQIILLHETWYYLRVCIAIIVLRIQYTPCHPSRFWSGRRKTSTQQNKYVDIFNSDAIKWKRIWRPNTRDKHIQLSLVMAVLDNSWRSYYNSYFFLCLFLSYVFDNEIDE